MNSNTMIRWFRMLVAYCCLSFVAIASAGETQVDLEVSNMTCAACPFIVKKSLTKVEGVMEASVSYQTRIATVTYDEQITSVPKLIEATAGVGFPSKPVK